jgi:DNA-binding NarL/FixJ family response regulator
MNAAITVAVIDDHPIVREGIVAVIGTQPDMRVVAQTEAVTQLNAQADAIVLDWEIPGLQGARAIAALRERYPAAAIVVFSAYAGAERVRAAMDAGARAYILKGSPAEELLHAIRTCVSGGVVFGRGIEPPFRRSDDAPTARESQVLELLARGYSNAQIAARLRISERTVKFHITSIFSRLGAKRRTEAVAIARERGLL